MGVFVPDGHRQVLWKVKIVAALRQHMLSYPKCWVVRALV